MKRVALNAKQTLLLVIGVGIVLCGAVGFMLYRDFIEDTQPQQNNLEQPAETLELNAAQDASYRLIVKKPGEQNSTAFARFEVESANRSYSYVNDGGQIVEFIIYDGTYYANTDENGWIAYEDENFTGGADFIGNFTLDASSLAELESTASFLGVEQCGTVLCKAYTSMIDSNQTKILVREDTNQIAELSGPDDEYGHLTLSFDYDEEVIVKLPDAALNAPVINLNELQGE